MQRNRTKEGSRGIIMKIQLERKENHIEKRKKFHLNLNHVYSRVMWIDFLLLLLILEHRKENVR